eukprot:TRINITY_DN9666_c0_g2_i2.p1 TRINITY_DN9666_c0_g2~~TRINITY_DN9666_c0_g2_i2.p1  ORF type:complete len:324 (-),score=69.22 TRINITY_DN9666_c0_g2_i2:53-964(-)
MTTLVAGTSLAAGLFVPMMLLGAVIGRIVGQVIQLIWKDAGVDASIYALVSSAALMSGFSRATISLVAIVMELTESTQFLLPIMLGVMTAKWVGDSLSHSIYDAQLELKSITFLDHKPPSFTRCKTVAEVMKSPVASLPETVSLDHLIQILTTNTHNGFPVYRSAGENRPKIYSGLILRKHILILLFMKKYYHRDTQSPSMLDWELYVSLMNKKWFLEELLENLPERPSLRDYQMDLKPYIDRSHPLVVDTSSFQDAYRTFQVLALRHLPVIDHDFQIVGILTRHDLLSFYNPDHEDRNKITF